jgi:hypothetical protein
VGLGKKGLAAEYAGDARGETVLLQIGTIKVGENHVDEIMCCVQGTSKKAAIVGFGLLPMWMGVVGLRRGSRETY